MSKMTVILVAGMVLFVGAAVYAMAPHALDLAGLHSPGGALTQLSSSSAPENDRPTWFSNESGGGPSLAAGYAGGQPATTGTVGQNNTVQDVASANPDTRPRDPIPEPATMVLLGSGLLAAGLAARRYFVQ